MTITMNENQAINEFKPEDIKLLKETICKGATDQDFKLFLMICQRTKLDPFAKQIYAVMRYDSNLGRNSMTIQTSIDGLRLVAERTGKYAPGKESKYEYTTEGRLRSATSYVMKQTTDGTWHEVASTCLFDEYCQRKKDGGPTTFWLKMGHVMIAKCAEAAALRRAFPMELASLYTADEMQQAIPNDSSDENLPLAEVEDSAIETHNKFSRLIGMFPPESREKANLYMHKWMTAHSKTLPQALERFSNFEEFKKVVDNWEPK